MKKTTSKTILKQGENTYQPIETHGVIYWFNPNILFGMKNDWIIETHNPIVKAIYQLTHDNDDLRIAGYKDMKIVAQSQPKIEGVPVISLGSYVESLANKDYKSIIVENPHCDYQSPKTIDINGELRESFIEGYNSNPNKWSDADVLKAIELAKEQPYFDKNGNLLLGEGHYLSTEEILEQISQIEVIEVDEQFNILSYE